MRQILKETVVSSIYRLKENSNNKIWGIICLFASVENEVDIKPNLTYSLESDKLSEILQRLFYYGEELREFTSKKKLYFRMSNKWESTILDYVGIKKPKILDAAIFFFKMNKFEEPISCLELVEFFIAKIQLPKSALSSIFDLEYDNEIINTGDNYSKKDILSELKNKLSIQNDNHTLSFDSPFTIKSHPSELKRAPFIQTLYSGSKIQELILLTDFNLDEFYPQNALTAANKNKCSSLNKIFYGAPGTGKSHRVKEIVRGREERTERVTFHPEYDYTSFVGGYKPTMHGDNIRYEFVPQAFTNIYIDAWSNLEQDYYLVIEEINRGNCAEIFGDIFQILDRSNDYEISPSKELKEYLKVHLSERSDKLLLPPNLNILATMNTSDQSLFPMDSAFKRRWDWEYVRINYDLVEDNISSKFVVNISDSESFSWVSFIKSVNELIRLNDNLGMDKCIGNYFIKPTNETIEIGVFINKAIFYLWNDVFKDEIEEYSIFKNKTSYEDFFPINEAGVEKVREILGILEVAITTTEE